MYSDYIKINKNFQTSINLELDLNSDNKIEEYIPTRDICDVLKRYISSIISTSGDKATTLVGPYGKGKSFLLLVLTYLVSQDPKKKTYKQLCEKIKKIDKDLFEMIQTLNKSKKRLLPVIVNSNYENLNQAFMLALNEALKREEITDIIPKTAYSVCLDLIDDWNNDPEHISKVITRCENELKTPLRTIEMGLKNFSPEAYSKFETLYNCVTHGMPFNPLVNDDIVHIYSEVCRELSNHGFSGIFIVFDEFSKFLESSGESVSKNLKVVQDFAELAARSTAEEQLHICCVTHKSLALYKSSDKADSFKTVEGRFKEIKFNRSLDENYQIISAAINNDNAKEIINDYIEKNRSYYDSLTSLEIFNKEIDLNDLYRGCFPLNPLTVYILIQLSEMIAQNERTLFTFISDTDDNSFNSFIHKNDDGLFCVDKIYDYFSPLMKREEGNDIRNIWYRAEGTLSRVSDPESRKIIKALAVILMINDSESLPANEKIVSLSLQIAIDAVTGKIRELIDQHYLRKNAINDLLSFATSNNKEIEDRISIIAQTKSRSISYDSVLDDINEARYLLPRRHNEQNKITRFYKVSFITEDQLCKLSSFDLFREREFSDGIILNLIRVNLSEEDIKKEFSKFQDNRVLLRYPVSPIKPLLFEELIRHVSLQEMLYKGGNDPVITNEIDLLLQETDEDIKELIAQDFETNFRCLSTEFDSFERFNDLLSDQMDRVYTKKIIFNNELINKNVVTSVYQKAANNVINDLIDKKEKEYTPTSPETTIKHSVVEAMDQPDIREILDDIKAMIIQAEKSKLRISDIVDKYTSAPYGLRLGIISVIFAKCINELSDNILLYLKDKEIDLTASNLVKAVTTDSEYYFKSSKGTIAQANYVVDMLHAFAVEPTGVFRVDTKTLCEEYRKFFMGLPMILRNADQNSKIKLPLGVVAYKKQYMSFSLNAYEAVFEKPLEIYEADDYDRFVSEIKPFIQEWPSYLDDYKNSIIRKLKEMLSVSSSTSLRMGVGSLIKLKTENQKPVLNDANSSILSTLESLSFDDAEALNQICNATLGIYVEDWSTDRTDDVIERIESFFDELSASKKVNTSTSSIDMLLGDLDYSEHTPMGMLFQNNMESILDEFGDSVSTEEKIAVLSSLLKKYL